MSFKSRLIFSLKINLKRQDMNQMFVPNSINNERILVAVASMVHHTIPSPDLWLHKTLYLVAHAYVAVTKKKFINLDWKFEAWEEGPTCPAIHTQIVQHVDYKAVLSFDTQHLISELLGAFITFVSTRFDANKFVDFAKGCAYHTAFMKGERSLMNVELCDSKYVEWYSIVAGIDAKSQPSNQDTDNLESMMDCQSDDDMKQ